MTKKVEQAEMEKKEIIFKENEGIIDKFGRMYFDGSSAGGLPVYSVRSGRVSMWLELTHNDPLHMLTNTRLDRLFTVISHSNYLLWLAMAKVAADLLGPGICQLLNLIMM